MSRSPRPKALTFAITNRCNLRCLHCWPDSSTDAHNTHAPLATLQRLITQSALSGVERLILTGGEPLTHPDWLKAVTHACSQPKLREVCIQTNATLLTNSHVQALASLEFPDLTFQVSLDGASAKPHDLVRGAGSFDKVMNGLRLLVDVGLGKQTRVAFTEMHHNISYLPELLQLLEILGVGSLVSGTLVRGGRASKGAALHAPTPIQYQQILRRFDGDPDFSARYRRLANIAALEWHISGRNSRPEDCVCGETPYLTHDGKLYPCAMFQDDAYAVEGLVERPFAHALNEAEFLWGSLEELKELRRSTLEECTDCPGWKHCGGGCPGRAFAASGDPMTAEDRCNLRRAVYDWES